MKALLIVDVQNDFCTGGALAVKNGEDVIPVINELMDIFSLVIASKDFHPEDSIHFENWPPHCIANTFGAEFHPDLHSEKIDKVVLKGTRNKDDGYSAFEATNDNLEEYLKTRNIKKLYITGLATDYCVKATALDAAIKGFETFVILDAVKAVSQNKKEIDDILNAMKQAGIKLIQSNEI